MSARFRRPRHGRLYVNDENLITKKLLHVSRALLQRKQSGHGSGDLAIPTSIFDLVKSPMDADFEAY